MQMSARKLKFSAPARPDGCEELTWGQRFIWDLMQNLAPKDTQFNLAVHIPLEHPLGEDGAIAVLRSAIEAFEAIRTVIRQDPRGAARQHLHDQGEIEVVIADLSPAQNRAEASAALMRDMKAKRFEDPERPHLRAGIVKVDGAPKELLLVLPHLSVDIAGRANLRRAIGEAISGARPFPYAERPWQPRDQSAWETGPAGRKVSDESLRYWRSELQQFPLSMFPQPLPVEVPEKRWARAVLSSQRLGYFSRQLIAKYSVTFAPLSLALFATVIAHRAQRPSCALMTNFVNRLEPNSRDAVGTFVLPGPIHLPVQTDDFAQTVRAARTKLFLAYKNARAAPPGVQDLLHHWPDGQPPETFGGIVFNNHFGAAGGGEAGAGEPPEDKQAVVEWSETYDKETSKLLLDIVAPDKVSILADTAFVPRPEVARLLLTVEFLAARLYQGGTDPWRILDEARKESFAGRLGV